MTPRFAVVQFTTPTLTFAEDLELYKRVGADGIGIIETKLSDDGDDLERFEASGLVASSFFPSVGTILPMPTDPADASADARVSTLIESIRRLAPFRPEVYCVVTGPYGAYDHDRAADIVVDSCRKLAAVAADEGMKLGVEVMHSSLADDLSFVTTLSAAAQLVNDIGAPNVGLVLDAWHLGEDVSLSEVRAYASLAVSVHVDDRRVPTRSWCDRVLPGDGSVDWRGLLSALEEGGFQGWYELEVISDDGRVANDFPDSLWKLDPEAFVGAGRAQFMSLWSEARETANRGSTD